jgi:Porin subfamily
MEVEMKMVKSLLLGTAAGLVAVAGAQAADMPVKAKPVQYVKICSLYGDGFYYLPGTDICLKIGGYVRAEYSYGGRDSTGSMTNAPFGNTSFLGERLSSQDFLMRTRAYAWFDSRQQTEYGTLRTYLQIGVVYDNPNSTSTQFNANRAFIQFAGFTAGTAQSFYDFYSSPATSFWGPPSSDTGDPGWKVFAYTQQFGNGISGTVSLEEPRRAGPSTTTGVGTTGGILNTNLGNQFALGGAAGLPNQSNSDTAKERFPDIVSNWRIDQAWGSAQVMFAAHDASGAYYAAVPNGVTNGNLAPNLCNTGFGSVSTSSTAPTGTGTLTGSEVCGHPADKVGWAAGFGAKINTFGGDYFQFQVNYAQGATRYVAFTPGGAFSPVQIVGQNLGYGILSDGIFSAATGDVQLTTAFGVNAAYEHFWRPDLRTSLYGYYYAVRYNDAANLSICTAQTTGNTAGTIVFAGGAGVPGAATASPITACSNNWSQWGIGSRTQWNITPWFYVGFDVLYSKLQTASNGAVVFLNATGAKPSALYTVSDQDNVLFRVRLHRDIVP